MVYKKARPRQPGFALGERGFTLDSEYDAALVVAGCILGAAMIILAAILRGGLKPLM